MSKKQNNIYPSFKSDLKCNDTFKDFIQGEEYRIIGFGNDFRDGKKVDVWYIKDLRTTQEFSVVKSTLNVLIDRKILSNIYK